MTTSEYQHKESNKTLDGFVGQNSHLNHYLTKDNIHNTLQNNKFDDSDKENI